MAKRQDANKIEGLDASSEERESYCGNFCHTVDEKGRVSLPADFRVVLESHKQAAIVLTNFISDGARCLEGFSEKSWHEFETKLRAKSRFDSKLQKLENFYLSRAARCTIDASGRILVPQHLRLYANLDKEATFTASIHGFRVWDTRVWNSVFNAAEQALLENPDLFAEVDV